MTLPVIQCLSDIGLGVCGACCMIVGRPPFPGYSRDRAGQPCTEFDTTTKLCRIYETRPEECRAFEPGSVQCRSARISQGLAA